tara:strand:+ start:403 stop:1167 length:765 start_codon:yes stop_codon:yes gene_type:complete
MSNYECKYCIRKYKAKYHYERHISVCQFLSKTPKEKEEDIDVNGGKMPTPIEMYQLVKHLSRRVDKLEKENHSLKRRETTKLNMLEWLNDKHTEKPIIIFDLWLTEELDPLIVTVLPEVYQNGLISGIKKLLEEYMMNGSAIMYPICSFNKSSGIIYVFDRTPEGKNEWKQLSTSGLDIYIEYLCNRFIAAFNAHWFEPNKENIHMKETYKEAYVNKYQKILAGHLSKESRCKQIRQIFITNITRKKPVIVDDA